MNVVREHSLGTLPTLVWAPAELFEVPLLPLLADVMQGMNARNRDLG